MVGHPSSPAWNPRDSKFTSVIYTNYVPSTEEITELQNLLVEPQLDLSRMESQIKQLQTALDELESKRHRLNAFIDAHRALMSPIRRLPPETLSEIFIRCLPTDRHPVRDLEEAPLLLTAICRGWREIALNTPAIWSAQHIVIPTSFSFTRRANASTLWLERSGSLPVSLSLYSILHYPMPPRLEVEIKVKVQSFIESLLRFAPRLADLTLQGSPELLSLFVGLLPETLLSVLSLHLRRIDDRDFPIFASSPTQDERPDLTLHALTSRMPRLRRLAISGFPDVASHYQSMQCSWNIVTHLTLHPSHGVTDEALRLGPVQILDILRLTPQLQSLYASVIIPSNPFEGNPSMIPLNHLRSLRFQFRRDLRWHHADLTQLTRTGALIESSINCPSLKLLSIEWYGSALTEPLFSSVLLDKVETLIVLGVPMTSAALTRCLTLTSNLISLEMHDVGIGYWSSEGLPPPFEGHRHVHTLQDSLLASFTPSNTNPAPLCPKLRHLAILRDCEGQSQEISASTLFSFIESRRRSQMLASCDIVLSEELPFPDEHIRRLRELRDGGLRLRILLRRTPPSQDHPTTGAWMFDGVASRIDSAEWSLTSII